MCALHIYMHAINKHTCFEILLPAGSGMLYQLTIKFFGKLFDI